MPEFQSVTIEGETYENMGMLLVPHEGADAKFRCPLCGSLMPVTPATRIADILGSLFAHYDRVNGSCPRRNEGAQ